MNQWRTSDFQIVTLGSTGVTWKTCNMAKPKYNRLDWKMYLRKSKFFRHCAPDRGWWLKKKHQHCKIHVMITPEVSVPAVLKSNHVRPTAVIWTVSSYWRNNAITTFIGSWTRIYISIAWMTNVPEVIIYLFTVCLSPWHVAKTHSNLWL